LGRERPPGPGAGVAVSLLAGLGVVAAEMVGAADGVGSGAGGDAGAHANALTVVTRATSNARLIERGFVFMGGKCRAEAPGQPVQPPALTKLRHSAGQNPHSLIDRSSARLVGYRLPGPSFRAPQ